MSRQTVILLSILILPVVQNSSIQSSRSSQSSGAIQPPSAKQPSGRVSIENKEADRNAEDYEDNWECGGEDLSKAFSYQMIDDDCPKLKGKVNGCCKNHDQCYEKQRGQGYCDKIFCDCLNDVTYSADNSTWVCYTQHALYFCETVKEFGRSFYEASVKKNDSDSQDYSGEEPAAAEHKDYRRVYEREIHNQRR